MKCLESEKLMGYAYRLIDEPLAAEVRGHLEECARCRAVVEEHGRVDAVLSEWRVTEPTPAFDARVRQAVEADQARRRGWGWQWFRWLALASLGWAIVAGAIWLSHNPHEGSRISPSVAQQRPAGGAGVPTLKVNPRPAAPPVQAKVMAVVHPPNVKLEGVPSTDDRDAQAIEDYDLAANFDLLSEIPKREPRVAN